jgi:hypothetical protein
MLLPAAFGYNAETAPSNTFMRPSEDTDEVSTRARGEVEAMATCLVDAGIGVELWEDDPTVARPDAPFVNNWLSTDRDGRVFLYPMATPSRRAEVRPELVDGLGERFVISEVVDWSPLAAEGRALEGTGSLVIDRDGGRVFACRSPRTDPELARRWAALQGLELLLFDALGADWTPIYHTNVLIDLAAGISLCALGQIPRAQQQAVADALRQRGELIELDSPQLNAFAGNMLQLVDRDGAPLLVLSTTALASLRPEQLRLLEAKTALLPVSIPTIERAGGGSARCLMAENYLKPRIAKPAPDSPG